MFEKKIKIKIPKTTICNNCGEKAKLDYKRLTHDNVLVAIYKCECKHEVVRTKTVKFI